jgi:hypothetical protein
MKTKLVLIILSIILFSACTDKENAEKFLKKEGYYDITITGYNFFECTKDDSQSTGFIAKKNAKLVEGTVCTGMLLRNNTIKLK